MKKQLFLFIIMAIFSGCLVSKESKKMSDKELGFGAYMLYLGGGKKGTTDVYDTIPYTFLWAKEDIQLMDNRMTKTAFVFRTKGYRVIHYNNTSKWVPEHVAYLNEWKEIVPDSLIIK